MLIVMHSHATDAEIRSVMDRIESLGYRAHPIPGSLRTAIGITGNKGSLQRGEFELMPGVDQLPPVIGKASNCLFRRMIIECPF